MKEPNPALVVDEQSFLEFAALLHADFLASMRQEKASPSSPYGPAPGGWENVTLERFLEAAMAWAEDSKSVARTKAMSNPWHFFACFLWAGKMYE